VTPVDLPFEEIWLHDFEFVALPGERPGVVCLAAHELRSGQTLRLWRDELGARPPYRTDGEVLFVNFVANAEVSCHFALGWPAPKNVLDLNPAFRNLTNGRSTPEGKGLIGLLRHYNLDAIDAKRKEAMQQRVMQGPPFTVDEREQILRYCASDVDSLARILPRILPEIDLGVALYHGEFAAASALMQHHGVPIDMEVFRQLADVDIWRQVRDEMVPAVDAKYRVYTRRNDASDWTFNMELFAAYLVREGIHDVWPVLESGALNMRRKTFEDMTKAFPQLEELRQLRHTRDKMRKMKLEVGADGRNRAVLWPFKAKTSRTQPKASQWIFSPAVWLRSLIKPEPGMAVAYVDYSSMEFLIAASLSHGHCGPVNPMLEFYQSGDPYLNFARSVGAVPKTATKQSHSEVRDKYKTMLLATQYGMSTQTLAVRLGVSTFEAYEMLNQHRELFAQYWAWSDDWVAHAMQTGVMRTAFGWTYHIGIVGQINERSLRN
jgi:DNA polymerase family A